MTFNDATIMTFREFIESSGMMDQDFSSLSLQDRMAQGRDIGEQFIRNQLKLHGIEIMPARGYHQDAHLKIDGFWNREPVQIKLRRSSKDGSNDIAYEVVRNHDNSIPLINQLQNPEQQGRDWKGQVKHYFVMNQAETEIYHISAQKLKDVVWQAVQEAHILRKPITSNLGVDLRPTRDPDPNSFTPFKVMAFVPVESVVEKRFPINKNQTTPQPNQPQSQFKQNWLLAIMQAEKTGSSTFVAPNNKKLIKPFQRFAKKKGLDVSIQGNQVVVRKAA